MQATLWCRDISNWFQRKQWNKEWFQALQNNWTLELSDEYLHIQNVEFRRRILERVETGKWKRDVEIQDLLRYKTSCWDEGDKLGEKELDLEIKKQVENCIFQYDQIMSISHSDWFGLVKWPDIKLLLDNFPQEKIWQEEVFINFLDFFTVVFGVHDFPSERGWSVFHPAFFTYYWITASERTRKEQKLDETRREVILFHDNYQEIKFWMVEKDFYWLWILSRENK